MIDRDSRDRLAELLRHLVCGQMTNDDFCDTAGKIRWASKDLAVRAIYEYADGLYSDLQTYRLRGPRRVSDEHRRQTAIAAMFLYSDLEYEWPKFSGWHGWGDLRRLICAAIALTFGIFLLGGVFIVPTVFVPASALCFAGVAWLYFHSPAAKRREYLVWRERQNQFGDIDVWPFLRRADFDRARQFPRLLTGRVRESVA